MPSRPPSSTGGNAAFIESSTPAISTIQRVDASWRRAYFAELGRRDRGAWWSAGEPRWAPTPERRHRAGPRRRGRWRRDAGRGRARRRRPRRCHDSIRAPHADPPYRVRGHLEADLDPLGLTAMLHPELDPRPTASPRPISTADLHRQRPRPRDRDARARSWPLRATYCGKIGVEFMHIQDPAQKAWIQERIECAATRPSSPRRASSRYWSG